MNEKPEGVMRIYYTSGKTEAIAVSKEPTLKEMQSIVGGWIELVNLAGGVQMIVNEEGKLHKLDYNRRATEVFRKGRPWSNDEIVGNAIVLTGAAKLK